LSAGGVADDWMTQLLRQGDAKVLFKLNRQANELKTPFLSPKNM